VKREKRELKYKARTGSADYNSTKADRAVIRVSRCTFWKTDLGICRIIINDNIYFTGAVIPNEVHARVSDAQLWREGEELSGSNCRVGELIFECEECRRSDDNGEVGRSDRCGSR